MRKLHLFSVPVFILLWLLFIPVSAVALRCSQAAHTMAHLPVSGVPVPTLAAYDQAMDLFMSERSITAGELAVMKNGVIVLEHGYGWKDKAQTIRLNYNALFRWASIIKPVTAAAVKNLAVQGLLGLSDKVFCIPASAPPCHLAITPFGAPDSRLKDVTIQHLLNHTGGWDRALSGDPMFRSIQIAAALGVPSPPSQIDTVRYMMGRPLDHPPGATYAYSNFGYLLLGLIIEQVTGQDYTAYIHETIFGPAGVAESEVVLGRTLPQDRNPREPWYACPGCSSARNVFTPAVSVPYPDGGWYLEAMEAHAGMIGSARAMATFLQAYWIGGEPRSGDGQNWWFYGKLDGTFTLAYQRADGVNLVALFNQRNDSSGLNYDTIKTVLDTATDSITKWPDAEPAW